MMHPMLNIAIKAARQASKMILRYADQLDKVEISEKNESDFVTQVDTLSEEIIIQEIQKAYPQHAILAEESGDHNMNSENFCWVIDPLNGTYNFMHGYPQLSISIAVMRKGAVEMGIVYDPYRQELFTATRGQGAYLNSRRIRISSVRKMNEALIGTGFPIRDKSELKNYLPVFEKVITACSDVRRMGSSSLDLAYVAAGRLDGFWQSGLKVWDMAAGSLMIKEAGGIVTDFQHGDNYLQSGKIVAANPKVYKELVQLISG